MAGRPKKRAQLELEKKIAAVSAGGTVPLESSPASSTTSAPIPDAQQTVGYARTRARTHARPMQGTTRAQSPGPATRAAIDDGAARVVRSLATVIKPGMRLRLSRTRPTWAAGFLEDYPVSEGDSLATFFEHVRDEYGGQSYTVEVLAAGDVQAFEGALTVAGPPMERGKPINRAKWECRDEEEQPARRTNVVERAAPAFPVEAIVSIATLVLGAFQKHQSEQLSSVKEMVTQSRELVVAALGQRDKQEQRTSFAAQLGEIVDATQSLDKVRKVIAGPTPRATARGDEDESSDTALMVNAAKKAFFGGVAEHFARELAPKAAGAPAPGQVPARAVPRRQRPPQSPVQSAGFIPDAQNAGQPSAEN